MKCINCGKETIGSTVVGIAKVPICVDCYELLDNEQLQKLVQNSKEH